MLARRLPGLLPPLKESEALQVAAIQSTARQPAISAQWRKRPFRAPHHNASAAAMVGGGSTPRPGEISLAHNGVLFLDELPEYQRSVLEVLREPLESGEILISRARQQLSYPARFQLIAAMNPCPCGYLGAPDQDCRCTPEQVRRYRGKISGPLLDRIDMHVAVSTLKPGELTRPQKSETSAVVRERVLCAQQRQQRRCGKLNARLTHDELDQHCRLNDDDRTFLEGALQRLRLSARAYHRILKVARTIADLENAPAIGRRNLAEAINLRGLDRPM